MHEAANQWVIHTLEVRLALASFDHQFNSAEASLKSYGKTRRSGAEAGGKSSLTQARKSLLEIQRLTSDNPNQQRRIHELNSVFGDYTGLFGSSSAVRPSAAVQQQQDLSDRIRHITTDMDQEEIRLLGLRTDRTSKLQTILSLATTGTLLLGILGTLAGTSLLSDNVAKRIAQLAESSVLMGEGLPVKVLDPSKDEIGQLASTFAQTSHVLSERAGEIAEINWKFESVLRAATSVSIIAEDATGRISLFSAGATRMLGYSAEEVMGRNLAGILREDSVNAGREAARRQIPQSRGSRQAEPAEYEAVYVRKDGVLLDVYVSTTPLKSLAGNFMGRLHVAQDITPRKLLEAELRKKIETTEPEKAMQSNAEGSEGVHLPEWLRAGELKDVGRLSSKVEALNNWYESHGRISNAHEENALDAPRILIVDDFEPTRFLLRAYLQGEGYQLDFASSGKEALQKVAEGTYKLILMDVEMPEMDGYEAASRIRSWERSQGRPEMPIVALSAHDQRGLDHAGVWTSHIQKPVSKGQLIEEVKSYVEVRV